MSQQPEPKKRHLDADQPPPKSDSPPPPEEIRQATDLICVDVEGSGPNVKHHFMPEYAAVHIKIGSDTPLDTFYRSLAAPPGTDWSAETLATFWAKPDKKTGIAPITAFNERRIAFPPIQVKDDTMNEFVDWVRTRNEIVKAEGGVLIIVTDTAGYDTKWIDTYLSHYSTKASALDEILGYYQPTRDISSFYIGLGRSLQVGGSRKAALRALGLESANDWGNRYAHNHDPASDAKHIAASASYVLTMMTAKQK